MVSKAPSPHPISILCCISICFQATPPLACHRSASNMKSEIKIMTLYGLFFCSQSVPCFYLPFSAHCITMYFCIQIPNISDCWLLFLNKLYNTFSRQVQSIFPLLYHLHQILLFLLHLHKPSANLFQIIPRILCHPPNWAPSLLCIPFCTPHEVPLQFFKSLSQKPLV